MSAKLNDVFTAAVHELEKLENILEIQTAVNAEDSADIHDRDGRTGCQGLRVGGRDK